MAEAGAGGGTGLYRIVVEGSLPAGWLDWFGDLVVRRRATPDATNLVVRVPDQSALFGLLQGIRDANGALVTVERLGGRVLGSSR